ncbi:alpha/beta hydrolase [Siccirubricoccus sp. G192]|uniref:alpha/beta hydrolase n=1 Tax=Siccirubricoccus sp. G192 TaxID=2849651 RepID=UPI001C2BF807|nr:dienelactone hydrolase family protein [Siccirubricoccus sp. G192]MBV1800097.1 dienelactone hydrolase family protein [Siccirubricoccus sp. G192]
MRDVTGGTGPHAGQPIATMGAPPAEAAGALILAHGRGGDAEEMLGLAGLVAPPALACLAPQAAGNTWYPYRFTEPVARNEPYLSSALAVLDDLVDRLVGDGVPVERIALLGFSQGACLALEFARRRAQRLGAVIGLSGGLIGDSVAPATGAPIFAGMPILLGCSERDPHIPIGRVRETEVVMQALGAEVVTRIYPGGDHGINEDEAGIARRILARVAGATPPA